jgi:2-methylcitrate dehydratase PrpD
MIKRRNNAMDAIYGFVENFKKVKYADLQPAVVEAAKSEVLDSLANALGGSSKPGVVELLEIMKEWGGNEQSTIFAYDIKCPTPNAAQLNSTMVHALDYDDGHPVALVHTGCTTVPTCLAVAERMGGITGKELITNIALGVDFMARLSLASRPGSDLLEVGYHPTAFYGYLGAAAMASRIMGLDSEKMLNALGIAYHQCSGNMQCIHDGALTKRLGPGFASRAGITAAIMAEKGITGARNCLEGKAGLFTIYHGGDYDVKILKKDLGKKFETENLGFKPYPCCGHTHAAIDAILTLKSKYPITADQVQSVEVFAGGAAYALCSPEEVKRNPKNIVDAQFSLPWTVATCLVKGKVTLEDFTKEAITNESVLQISNKVTGHLDPDLSRHGVGPTRVSIKMKNGAEYTEFVEFCLGSVERPMAFADCVNKFRECYPASVKPLSPDAAEKIIEMIRHLEDVKDATEIVRIL